MEVNKENSNLEGLYVSVVSLGVCFIFFINNKMHVCFIIIWVYVMLKCGVRGLVLYQVDLIAKSQSFFLFCI